MPTGYTWASYQAAVVTQIPTLTSDPNFVTVLPNSIDYAELSCYRDLDFLTLKNEVSLGSTQPGIPSIGLVTVGTTLITVESLYYTSAKIPILPVSYDYILSCYNLSPAGPPEVFATRGGGNQLMVYFGPTPDTNYPVFAYGEARPSPLSASNTTTWLSANVPDLFWAAAMIYWSGYTKNFGAMTDDPKMGISWESEYQRILKGASVEAARQKFQSQGWQADSPPTLASPRT